jgi:catechol 2,3-dioxygenase-like lactoylglutathione lyase family enzyme
MPANLRPTRLHHVGVVLPDRRQLDELVALLELPVSHTQYVPEYEAECVFAGSAGAQVEFVVPRGGKLARFNRGAGGLHHIALEVDDLDVLQARLAAKGVRLLEETPVEAGDIRINFLPPVHTRGVIVEFVERVGRTTGVEGRRP